MSKKAIFFAIILSVILISCINYTKSRDISSLVGESTFNHLWDAEYNSGRFQLKTKRPLELNFEKSSSIYHGRVGRAASCPLRCDIMGYEVTGCMRVFSTVTTGSRSSVSQSKFALPEVMELGRTPNYGYTSFPAEVNSCSVVFETAKGSRVAFSFQSASSVKGPMTLCVTPKDFVRCVEGGQIKYKGRTMDSSEYFEIPKDAIIPIHYEKEAPSAGEAVDI